MGLRTTGSAPRMDLETLLPAIRSLQDLPRLVAALGHQPLWDEFPGERRRIAVVGRTGQMPWLGFESAVPQHDTASLARHRSRQGHVSLVLGLDPSCHRLAIAIGFAGFPVLEVELARPTSESLASLRRLAGTDGSGYLAFAARAADALAAETVGRRFFREFSATLHRMAAGLPGPIRPDDRQSLALLQLTRVLFLYFIQAKGWLGGRERFLAEEIDSCLRRGRRIHGDLLRPLFFGTLNRPIPLRTRTAARFGPTPFLNGGLFEPHPLERRFRADIPNDLWRDAFDGLFERFHFTVVEGDTLGGVAPDMLGRVFEGVMAPDARRASGTFYTPASLVGAVIDAALVALLVNKLDCSESTAERCLQDPDPETRKVLAGITVLDPAVGSGAFLLGALSRLSGSAPARTRSARKREVLRHNLFGVDQSAAAVRLTELRLWLAVIADEATDRMDLVDPLPNLDCLIRQGDSLIDPIDFPIQLPERNQLVELAGLRRSVVISSGPEKRDLLRKLRALELRVANESLTATERQTQLEAARCLSEARGRDLFGSRRGLDRELRARLADLRNRIRSVRQAQRKLRQAEDVPWFHYQTHFADVFGRGGFDLVVGNPPWIRSEEVPQQLRSRLTGRYRWWRPAGGRYGNRPDLAVAFLERAFELSSKGAVVGMILPAKILSARYGATARHELASSTTLHVVADLTGDARAEFEATVYPLVLVASNAKPPAGHTVQTTLGQGGQRNVRQVGLAGGGAWVLRMEVGGILERLERTFSRIADRFTCHVGAKTGANHIFLNPPDDLEPEVLRWAVRGRDLEPFRCRSRTRLLWTHDVNGNPRSELPARCAAYLRQHHAELRTRKDFAGGPPWILFRAKPAVSRHRVVWADLARRLTAAALTSGDDTDRVPLNSCYVTSARSAVEAERLCAWLNCTWVRAIARLKAVPAASGFARYNAETIGALPLPESVLLDAQLTQLARAGRLKQDVQLELDRITAAHLTLSAAARSALRAIVCGPADHRS
jgi:Eco57I restriction-modification methylase/N-6 DNA Methylase